MAYLSDGIGLSTLLLLPGGMTVAFSNTPPESSDLWATGAGPDTTDKFRSLFTAAT